MVPPSSGWTINSIANINDNGCLVGEATGTDGYASVVILAPVAINVVSYLNPAPGQPTISASATCVGEPVTLSITGTNDIPGYNFVTGYNWHISNGIKGFNQNATSVQVPPWLQSDLTGTSITPYFPVIPQNAPAGPVSPSGTEAVSCDLTLLTGGTCTIMGTLAIVTGTVQITGSTPGPIYVSRNNLDLAGSGILADGEDSDLPDAPPLGSSGPGLDGESQGVVSPSGFTFTSGSIAWLQVISDTASVTSSGTYGYGNLQNLTMANDHGFPYGNQFGYQIKPQASSYHTEDGPEIEADDPPQTELDRAFSGQMYYMWLPGVPHSIWVPLRVISWGFTGQIEWSGSQFILTGSSKSQTSITTPGQEPNWGSISTINNL